MRRPDGKVHWSDLKNIGRSPAHYLESLKREFVATPAMRLGTAIHTLVLGGGAVAVFDAERRGNAWKDFQAENTNKLILTPKEHTQCLNAAHAVMAHDGAMRLLTGKRERPIAWERAGFECAGTPDVAGPDYVTELKTTTNAEPNWFMRHARGLGYTGQLAWYRNALKVPKAFCVAVEVKAPHAVTVFQLTEEALDEGDRLAVKYLEQLRVCEDSGVWQAYSDAIVQFDAMNSELIFDEEEEAAQ